MPDITFAADLDDAAAARLASIAAEENRSSSQIIAVALRMFLEASQGARQAAYAIDGAASDEERRFAASLTNRAALKAYERIIDSRNLKPVPNGTNTALASEDEIEAEAVRACRM